MKILIISPTYNEKKNIPELITQVSKISYPLDLLIIDDNSPDGTADIIKNMVTSSKNFLKINFFIEISCFDKYIHFQLTIFNSNEHKNKLSKKI